MSRSVLVCIAAAALLSLPGRSHAAPFTATYAGQVGVAFSDPEVLAFFPVGTPIAFELTFDDLFLTDSASIFTNPGPHAATGTLTVGAVQTQLTSFSQAGATFDFDGLVSVNYLFQGTGPDVGGGTFLGLTLVLTPALTLDNPPFFTYAFPSGNGVVHHSALAQDARQFEARPAVPGAPLGVMMVSGLAAIVGRRLRAR
jgi:hypothetical protein